MTPQCLLQWVNYALIPVLRQRELNKIQSPRFNYSIIHFLDGCDRSINALQTKWRGTIENLNQLEFLLSKKWMVEKLFRYTIKIWTAETKTNLRHFLNYCIYNSGQTIRKQTEYCSVHIVLRSNISSRRENVSESTQDTFYLFRRSSRGYGILLGNNSFQLWWNK